MDSKNQYYRAINGEFLNKSWREGAQIGFELFYKVKGEGEPKYLKFASYTPETREKIQKLVNSENGQELFIHETELLEYYDEFLIPNIADSLEKDEPTIKVLNQVYDAASRILKEYFDNIASTRILRRLEPLVEMLQEVFARKDVEFSDLLNITQKENDQVFHCVNVGFYSLSYGVCMNVNPHELRNLGLGGMLFDIGKKFIPKEILLKEGELSPDDWSIIRKHPSAGKKVLNDMKCYNENILKMVSEHHEKYDGEGYPFGLVGKKISWLGRVCCVIDVFDALASWRPKHEPLTPFQALTTMKLEMPGHFDEHILTNFIKLLAKA